jgi:hypothetical protein
MKAFSIVFAVLALCACACSASVESAPDAAHHALATAPFQVAPGATTPVAVPPGASSVLVAWVNESTDVSTACLVAEFHGSTGVSFFRPASDGTYVPLAPDTDSIRVTNGDGQRVMFVSITWSIEGP